MLKLLTAIMLTFGLVASACGDDSAPGTPTPGVDAEVPGDSTGDGVDDCGQGHAFPDDPDFREAICRPLLAMVDLIGTAAEINPEWGSRISLAILDYANRDTAMAELAAVLAEIEAAGG